MSAAEDINVGFTVAAMNPNRGAHRKVDVRGEVINDLRQRGLTPTGRTPSQPEMQSFSSRLSSVRTGRTSAAAPLPIRACSLELQHGRYRAFRRFDGILVESHECKVELIRRMERDGYHFTYE